MNKRTAMLCCLHSEIFKDWKEKEDKYLREIKDVTKHHIFSVDAADSVVMYCQGYDGLPVVKQPLVKKTAPTDWYEGFIDSLTHCLGPEFKISSGWSSRLHQVCQVDSRGEKGKLEVLQ
jgi:hypothetical protein